MMRILLLIPLAALIGCSSSADIESLCRESFALEKTIVRERKAGHRKEVAEAVEKYEKVNAEIKKYPAEKIYRAEQKIFAESALPKP